MNPSGKPDAGKLPVRFDEGDGVGCGCTVPTPQRHGRMVYDDQAPWAQIRISLTRPVRLPPEP